MQEEKVLPIRGYSEEPVFYVYFHKRPDGSIFYVGKGKNDRAWYKRNRNKHWWNVVNKHGSFDVEIVKSGLTEQEAFELEAKYVNEIGIDNLTNMTMGGISTTGYRHTEETRKLQKEIAQEKLKDPEWYNRLMTQMERLHYLQRNDAEYIKKMSELQKELYANLPEEEKARRAEKRVEWLKDADKVAAAKEKLLKHLHSEEARKNRSDKAKAKWASLTDEEYVEKCKLHTAVLNDPENRAKLKELVSKKVVVNRKYIFASIKDFAKFKGVVATNFHKAKRAADKTLVDFMVHCGYFIEFYNSELHNDCVPYDGQEIKKLSFDCLPRSKAVITEGRVFLSLKEAAIFTGLGSDARADFITKNLRLGKPAMGYMWREATTEEIKEEVLRRLEEINE